MSMSRNAMDMSWSRLSERGRSYTPCTALDFLLHRVLAKDERAPNHRIKPLAGVSSAINRPPLPITAPAASLPLRTAPSIVEGHSVAVQSPARYNPGHSVVCVGRNRYRPGTTEKAELASFKTPL